MLHSVPHYLPDLPSEFGCVRLPEWGLIRASGDDAVSFLQGQLTADVQGLRPGQATLGAYCSAKGRMLASMVLWREGSDVLMACSQDLLPALIKRLSMFVLRAKCKLQDEGATLRVHGCLSDEALPPWRVQSDGHSWRVSLPSAGQVGRSLWITPTEAAPETLSLDAWRLAEVASGVGRIVTATAEAFVPQMLNYEALGAVNFKKGCYPGQEVVARSQYRGTLKRRAVIMASPAPLQPGQEVFWQEDPEQAAGMVVIAQSHLALVEIKLEALGPQAQLWAAGDTGQRLEVLGLPYALPPQDG